MSKDRSLAGKKRIKARKEKQRKDNGSVLRKEKKNG